MENRPYRELVGALAWLTLGTRPDIRFATSSLARFGHNPGRVHWDVAKRVVRHLNGTKQWLLTLRGKPPQIVVFTDADWGSHRDDRRSIGAYPIKIKDWVVSLESKNGLASRSHRRKRSTWRFAKRQRNRYGWSIFFIASMFRCESQWWSIRATRGISRTPYSMIARSTSTFSTITHETSSRKERSNSRIFQQTTCWRISSRIHCPALCINICPKVSDCTNVYHPCSIPCDTARGHRPVDRVLTFPQSWSSRTCATDNNAIKPTRRWTCQTQFSLRPLSL